MSCGADTEANELLESLTVGVDFEIPDVDLSGPEYQIPDDTEINIPVSRLTNDDLTTGVISGSGTFDALMRGFKAHLKEEFSAGRITGGEYTKAYTALVEGAMANATQYLLGRDQAYWAALAAQQSALLAQVQVVTARVTLATAKVQLAALQLEALTTEANYALTKMKLSTESAQFCMITAQLAGQETANQTATYQLGTMLPKQYQLVSEQYETQRAQTLETRSDNATVNGVLGKQKALYTQQITSYQRDAELKAAKVFSDAWTVQKTIDEGLLPPDGFTNASLDTVLATIKTNNNLG